ncbi:GrpB family protein [Paenibacillus apiarius]|uniref:GrpB family protein n=1 Tax=Paenibacillus apiarius TaxID=46240 RepID=UPI00197EA322|nr:GrpB family protein [Paenibacillus apiarius]
MRTNSEAVAEYTKLKKELAKTSKDRTTYTNGKTKRHKLCNFSSQVCLTRHQLMSYYKKLEKLRMIILDCQLIEKLKRGVP